MQIYQKLFRYVPDKKHFALLAVLFSALSALLTVTAYYFIYAFIRHILITSDIERAKHYSLLIAVFIFCGAISYFFSGYCSHKLAFRLETNLRKRGIDGLTGAGFRFFDLHPSGLTRKIIDDNAAQTHMAVAHLIPDSAYGILTPILSIALGFIVSLKVGVPLLLITLIGFVTLALMMGDQKFMKIYHKALEHLSAETVEYVRGIQVIKIFGTGVTSFKALHQAITEYAQYAYNYSKSCQRPYVFFQLMFFGVIALLIPLLLLFTDYRSEPAALSVQLIMTSFLMGVLFVSFMRIMYMSMYFFQGNNAIDKLETLYSEMGKDALQFGQIEEFENFDIEFEEVCFTYKDTPVLDQLSFRLEGGKTYALVGSSGSGKSTIAKLISGFYKIDSGSLKIGGIPIENYSKTALIDHIAFVFQDAKLFKKTIYENVRLGRQDASHEEIMKALELAGCRSILDKFKEREHTLIGSKGIYLSGGERQRIAIARAILKDADIIIMDEASAAIDPENEHELQLAFANLMQGKTVIMIAHRLSSIRKVDEILVLENGRIIERGNDESLMNGSTKYKAFQDLYQQANEWRVGNE
ncbi:MAG: ABC transporter ATP-binding protein [Peptostreptococcaceae bacterium]|nr:ABC transporter ATP-binding protein [Peptostreptococcaceae bacterium]